MSNKVIMERTNHVKNLSMPEEIATLIARLADKDGFAREAARLELVDIGRPAVPALMRLLSDKRDQERWEAVNALAEIADPSSARALVRMLEDKVFDVRWLAAEGLIRIGAEALAPVLRALIINPEPDWLWEGVRHVVHGLAKGELEPVLSPVTRAFDEVDYRNRVPLEARRALERLGFETDTNR
jgi:HEAT repeat protein